ncbi:MAG TPA: hypothetical protein VE990_12785 [Acidimicrobiales bacterium]|nr:hypothetical protein [Acidimicrobiales bacterium]
MGIDQLDRTDAGLPTAPRSWLRHRWAALGAGAAVTALGAVSAAVALAWGGAAPVTRPALAHRPVLAPAPAPAAVPAPPPTTTSTTLVPPPTNLVLTGCPPPPQPPKPVVPPWHPAVLVPDSALPAALPPPPRRASLAPVAGKGMWIWQFSSTDGGDATAVVDAAVRAGLHQLWVRVGDSQNGFYGSSVLDRLVPLAHARGLAVIGWGFPYLYDPAGDAAWTVQALSWSSGGARLDGFSADLETSSEGVDMTAQRASVYLSLVRRARPAALLVGTVFPPTDQEWATYPYRAIAPYVDALAPMVYWGCYQPVLAAQQAFTRLGPLAPLHLIGQAYSMADVGGRTSAPSPAEISAFLQSARLGGALGASFWSWQSIDSDEWAAMAGFGWS